MNKGIKKYCKHYFVDYIVYPFFTPTQFLSTNPLIWNEKKLRHTHTHSLSLSLTHTCTHTTKECFCIGLCQPKKLLEVLSMTNCISLFTPLSLIHTHTHALCLSYSLSLTVEFDTHMYRKVKKIRMSTNMFFFSFLKFNLKQRKMKKKSFFYFERNKEGFFFIIFCHI